VAARDHRPEVREGQAGPLGVAERPVVPVKPGNSGGEKGPWFRVNVRSGESRGLAMSLSTSARVQKLQNTLHAKAKEEAEFRFYSYRVTRGTWNYDGFASRRSRSVLQDSSSAVYLELQVERSTSGGGRSLFRLQGRWSSSGKRQSGSVTRLSLLDLDILRDRSGDFHGVVGEVWRIEK